MRKLPLGLLVLAILAAAVALLARPAAEAIPGATITVDTTNDELNADGDCSLREAIQAANTDAAVDACTAGSGADTIVLPASTYTLSIAGANEDPNATGDLDITDGLTLTGAGQAITVIDGGALDRIFHVIGSVTVEIVDVAIQNGASGAGRGGAILNSGTLTLTNVTVSGNNGGTSGGGIYNDASGLVTLNNTTVSGNWASSAGGIRNHGTLTLNSSTVSGNTAGLYGGDGGGISNDSGTLTLNSSTVSDNTTGMFGAGIFNEQGNLEMSSSTVSGNTTTGSLGYGGGIVNLGGTATLTNVTISGNSAPSSYGDGGGIFNMAQEIIFIDPPGSQIIPATLTLTNGTLRDNLASDSGDSIFNDSYSTVRLKNTIVEGGATGENCTGTIFSDGHNLDSGRTCRFHRSSDLKDTDPILGPLSDSSGPTQTHALLAGSPAIDAGDNTGCPTTDQRGVPRPIDGDDDGSATCDIGAFEYCGDNDTDGDGIGDICDPDDDNDTVLDADDNCPTVPNLGQEDFEPDGIGDACDHSDGDDFVDAIELYLGTDPLDDCPDEIGVHDAWPLDISIDMSVTVVGDVLAYAGNIGLPVGGDPILQRLNINADSNITVVGDVLTYAGVIGESCT